jgi:hypothetical protein
MYLTGAAYDSHRNFFDSQIRLLVNDQGFGKYVEGKTFSVVSREGFLWNMKSASFLSWALDAFNYKNDKLGVNKSNKWTDELSLIWKTYMETLGQGLASIGIYKHLHVPNHVQSDSNMVSDQLNLIFPSKSSRYRDLSKVSYRNSPGISVVRVGKKEWPNLAFFARDVADVAVGEIENLADSLENEVIEDIKNIEGTKRQHERTMLKEKFCRKYASNSYRAVKEIFFEA